MITTHSVEIERATAWFEGKQVLITGGLGFIGSTLARRLLSARADVVVVDSLIPQYGGLLFNVGDIASSIRINISDVRDTFSLRYLVQGQDVIFNLAGQTSHLDSMEDPYVDLDINCRAQLSILESCRAYNPSVTIIYASTRQIYGKPMYFPVDEDHPISPVDVNGINKTSGEWYHLLYGTVYGVPVTVLRLTNTYGPRMRVRDARQTFLGVWLRQVLQEEEIQVYGDGTQRRDFNFVEDVVDAFIMAAASPAARGRVYNLGNEQILSLADLAELLVRLNGRGSHRLVPFPADRKAIDIGDYYGDYSRIRRELGWEPQTPLEEGLRISLEYFGIHGRHYWDAVE